MAQDMPDAKAEFVQERLLEAAAEALASGSNAAMPLRIVAARAGATTGAIQYYFGDKRGLLLAVMRKHGLRVVARLQLLETDTLPAPQVRVRKILFEFLPLDEERRHECIVADAFESLAVQDPAMADAWREQYALLAKLIADQLPYDSETRARHLLAFTAGLRTDVLLGLLTAEDAIASLDSFIELAVSPGTAQP
ncbi:TetR family transcriptional regulator C-terminal domain-containing protein [Streptomonospora nanhaiensis]|uniref:AcrR family transcriptional regulator n=1 Tax=Streptomonospora nanhaiensis TaxID=1323731 RepID=A0A853BTI6_9ACTN|nr:TetR family transcriptional regulator C-terminal domain-containing protein [Streptomonospora nanhaiensis]MBV2362830.1 TetR family transcriptional regulator C-terminal domain-containing protein [Streptomonospora nanhaiensis]MBX9386999.1 TetR family transcriptional regulator C-terminal domain-containing protein [Streptomonospora nanhaiensis]NYI97811.1 AcrR family transcriptional regulator [Streptomonospora nanhaiensis]